MVLVPLPAPQDSGEVWATSLCWTGLLRVCLPIQSVWFDRSSCRSVSCVTNVNNRLKQPSPSHTCVYVRRGEDDLILYLYIYYSNYMDVFACLYWLAPEFSSSFITNKERKRSNQRSMKHLWGFSHPYHRFSSVRVKTFKSNHIRQLIDHRATTRTPFWYPSR